MFLVPRYSTFKHYINPLNISIFLLFQVIMECQFKKDDWIWIEGLQGAKDLNGKLGQIVKFIKEKHRYEVFIPDLDCHKFNKEYLSKAILPDKQDDAQIKKLFPWREGRVANRMSWEDY